jgi:hypothetical protein
LTLISAGRSLAVAYAALGDKLNASNVIRMTIQIARSENFPPAYLTGLEELQKQFKLPN